MRKKLIYCFIALVLVPVAILYFASYRIFDTSKQEYLQMLSTKNIAAMKQTLNDYFSHPVELSMYPYMENNLLTFLKADGTENNYFSIYQNANSVLNATPYANDGILGISLYSASGHELYVGLGQNDITSADMDAAAKANGSLVWKESVTTDGSTILTACRMIRNAQRQSEKLGFIKVLLSSSEVKHLLNVANDVPGIRYYVVDAGGTSISCSEGGQPTQELKALFRQNVPAAETAQTKPITISGRLSYISSAAISKTPYLLYSVTPADAVFNIQSAFTNGLQLTAVILILSGILLALVLSKWLVKPLRSLSSMTETVASGDFSGRVTARGNDEIADLTRQFNRMTGKLQHLYNEVYASRIKQQQAEYSALLAKINPHFLHNTLDAIYWMAEAGKSKRVAKMVSALSSMMRYNISDDGADAIIPLREETDCLKSYLYIQQERYGDSIHFLLTEEPGLEHCIVLKLVLQPLVENAIIHGVAPAGSGIVNVLIYREKDSLIYEVRNTGNLAATEDLQKVLRTPPKGTKGFALKNISDRLRLKYGSGGKIEAECDGVQTIFRVTQPFESDNGISPE